MRRYKYSLESWLRPKKLAQRLAEPQIRTVIGTRTSVLGIRLKMYFKGRLTFYLKLPTDPKAGTGHSCQPEQ